MIEHPGHGQLAIEVGEVEADVGIDSRRHLGHHGAANPICGAEVVGWDGAARGIWDGRFRISHPRFQLAENLRPWLMIFEDMQDTAPRGGSLVRPSWPMRGDEAPLQHPMGLRVKSRIGGKSGSSIGIR